MGNEYVLEIGALIRLCDVAFAGDSILVRFPPRFLAVDSSKSLSFLSKKGLIRTTHRCPYYSFQI